MRRFAIAVSALLAVANAAAWAGDPPAKSAWETLRNPAQDYFNAPDADARKAVIRRTLWRP